MISAVMAVHRLDGSLVAANQSILNQTYTQFELIIVVNGTDSKNTLDHVALLNFSDERICIIESKINQLFYALNFGIDAAKYPIIARVDSDDISLPNRL